MQIRMGYKGVPVAVEIPTLAKTSESFGSFLRSYLGLDASIGPFVLVWEGQDYYDHSCKNVLDECFADAQFKIRSRTPDEDQKILQKMTEKLGLSAEDFAQACTAIDKALEHNELAARADRRFMSPDQVPVPTFESFISAAAAKSPIFKA